MTIRSAPLFSSLHLCPFPAPTPRVRIPCPPHRAPAHGGLHHDLRLSSVTGGEGHPPQVPFTGRTLSSGAWAPRCDNPSSCGLSAYTPATVWVPQRGRGRAGWHPVVPGAQASLQPQDEAHPRGSAVQGIVFPQCPAPCTLLSLSPVTWGIPMGEHAAVTKDQGSFSHSQGSRKLPGPSHTSTGSAARSRGLKNRQSHMPASPAT